MDDTDDETECCHNCAHCIEYSNGKGKFLYAECRFNPPTSQRVPSMSHREMFPAVFEWVTNWPRVERYDHCGQFKLEDR